MEADLLIRQAEAMWTGGDHAAINDKLRRALDIREVQFGPDSPLVADVLGRLGRNAWNSNDFATAEQMFRRALAIDQAAQPDSFDTARLLGDLGATLRERHDYDAAEALVRRSIEIRRRLVPPNPPFVAAGLDNLARDLERQHRYGEAAAAVQESLDIRRASLGAGDPQTRQSAAYLAALQRGLDAWRIVPTVGWLMAACGLGMVLLAAHTAYALRRRMPVWQGWLRLALMLACGLAAAYAAYVAAAAFAPLYLPVIGERDLRKLDLLGSILVFIVALGVVSRLIALVQRLAGQSPQSSLDAADTRFAAAPDTRFAVDDADIRHAVRVGKFWVNLPAMVLMLGCLLSISVVIGPLRALESKGASQGLMLGIVLAVITIVLCVSTAVGWLWWSVMVPRWLVWAMRRVRDFDGLFTQAVRAQLIWNTNWPMGRYFARTAWWTAELRYDAETLMAERANGATDPGASDVLAGQWR